MFAFQDHFGHGTMERPPKGGSVPGVRSKNPLEKPQKSSLICAGIITAPHGVQGHVKVKSFLENADSFLVYSPFYTEEGEPAYKVMKVLSENKDTLVLSLEGIQDRTAAEMLKGAHLMIPRAHLPLLQDETFYHTDLIGLQVLSPTHVPLGTVAAVHNFGAGDILEVQIVGGKREMLPFSKDMIPSLDITTGTLKVSQGGEFLLKGGDHDA